MFTAPDIRLQTRVTGTPSSLTQPPHLGCYEKVRVLATQWYQSSLATSVARS